MKHEAINKKLLFSAMVEFADDNSNEIFDVEINKDIDNLTYDEVEDAIWDAVDKKYGYVLEDFENDDLPYSVVDIVINENGRSYPVVPENADIEKLKEELNVEKFLVLPWARYGLTPECKLWMAMKNDGIVNYDEPFDYEVYHKLVEAANEKK